MAETWGVVVPVKRLALAKTRLSAYGDSVRQELALAFAADVVLAARGIARVLVITDDERAAEALAELGASVAPDDPDAGLNPALSHGADLLRADTPALGVATLSADVPALRADDLRNALAQVPPGRRGFVADNEGSGTTLLAAGAGAALLPAYGERSRERHLRSGAVQLHGAPGLRTDVDTPDDLLDALSLGAGPRTTEVATGLGLSTCQATVGAWREGAGGSAYRDDGELLELPPESLTRGVFRFVRVGQRVRLVLRDGSVVRVALP